LYLDVESRGILLSSQICIYHLKFIQKCFLYFK